VALVQLPGGPERNAVVRGGGRVRAARRPRGRSGPRRCEPGCRRARPGRRRAGWGPPMPRPRTRPASSSISGRGCRRCSAGRPRSCRPMTVRRGGGRVRPWRLLMCSWEIVGVGSAAGSDGGSSVGKALDAAGGGGRVAEPGELVVLDSKGRLALPACGRRRAPSKTPRPSRASTAAVHARGPPRPSAARLPRRHGLDLRSSGPRSTG
jgi:hypothetical protein